MTEVLEKESIVKDIIYLGKPVSFEEKKSIDGPGDYHCNHTTYRTGVMTREGHHFTNIIGDKPKVIYGDIPSHLQQLFPGIQRQIFFDASLIDKKYSPASFKFEKWRGMCEDDSNYIIFDGDIYSISSTGTFSNGGGSWTFDIKDIGDLNIVENELTIDDAIGRDGDFNLFISGDASHHSNSHKEWSGSIEYKGDHPGKLVAAVVDYVNEELKRLNAPLWKKVS